MKILRSSQLREADEYTIKHEPIASIDLMERASRAFVTKFLALHPEKRPVLVFCGTGNNGGDGLAIARLLLENGWPVEVFIIGNKEKGSPDFRTNLERLKIFKSIDGPEDFPHIPSDSIIVDGLFGSGLSRPVEGLYAELIKYLNNQDAQRVAIDISSGLYSDQPMGRKDVVFKADFTISFQLPKLAFFLPECASFVGKWRVVDIGLEKDFLRHQSSNFNLTQKEEMKGLFPKRSTFTHKNEVGRLLIVAGSKGKMGAAVLCAQAAFRSGAGLVNVHVPKCGSDVLQVSIPEAMVSEDEQEDVISLIPVSGDTAALGPGLGTDEMTVTAFRDYLKTTDRPIVVDADGINMLSVNKDIIEMLPEDSILTPHPGEFKRLTGAWSNDFDKLEKLTSFCKNYQLNVVLKGAFSTVCSRAGEIYFNPTGNPAMATAGSGDVLTGIVGALLAQGLQPFDALRLGVYLHGQAGDEAVRETQSPWIQASDIIGFIPEAVGSLLY